MPLNHYITLGRSGLRVSPLCLGAMTFGPDWGWGSSIEESRSILDRYIDLGGNFIDTANMYTRGHSEKIIGDHVGRHPARRDRLVIATKFLSNMYPGDPNGGGANRLSIINACEQSLRRLQTDHIDLYWMHFWDRFTPIDETMRAIDDLVRLGKVRYFGFSDTPAWKCAQGQLEAIFRDWTPAIALQIEYSLLERTVEGELLPMAREMGLGVTPWSPLKGGVLSGKYSRDHRPTDGRGSSPWVQNHLTDRAFGVVDVVRAVAAEQTAGNRQVSCSQVALAWVQSRVGVASTIIGARTLRHLDDNVGALDVRLTPDQIRRLDEATTPTLNFPAHFLSYVGDNIQGGTTINGNPSKVWPLAPQSAAERY